MSTWVVPPAPKPTPALLRAWAELPEMRELQVDFVAQGSPVSVTGAAIAELLADALVRAHKEGE